MIDAIIWLAGLGFKLILFWIAFLAMVHVIGIVLALVGICLRALFNGGAT